jgi:putative ABC transport system permease protein
MLRNYLKISIAVLLRRKFLTFVNLFGAVLTLTVLVVAYAIFDSIVSPAGAQHRQNHILLITNVLLARERGLFLTWGPGMAFHERYIATLETPDRISFAMGVTPVISYVDGRKLTSQVRRTDAAYWEILDFTILDGRVLAADDIEQGRFVAVINQATADRYFPGTPAVGRTLVAGQQSFEVIGVVANEPETSLLAFSDIWVPLTTATTNYRDEWVGPGHFAMLYVEDPSRRRAVREEYRQALEDFEFTPAPGEFQRAVSSAQTMLETVARQMIPRFGQLGSPPSVESLTRSRVADLAGLATVGMLLFMSLPAINMANLNIGRILERAPEIGLRKATGASRRVLAGQFIFENVVLCTLGGLVAFAVAPIVLALLNDTVFTYGRLTLNVPVFAAGFAFILIFGVLSGAYPAWKMAKLEPATALRGLQHD